MSDPTNDNTKTLAPDVQAEIARIFDEARDRALALVVGQVRSAPAAAAEPVRTISLNQAAKRANRTAETMQRHVISAKLGVKVGGRWRIDPVRLAAWLRGEGDEHS